MWHSKLDRVRIAHFEVYELLAGVFGGDGCGIGDDFGSVAHADETEDGGMAFGNSEDMVCEIGTDSS